MNVGCIGVNHHRAGADVRDRISLSAEKALAFQRRLAAKGVRQSFILSTCNRCEVFFWGDEAAVSIVRNLFVAEFPAVPLIGLMETRFGEDALVYLFRIAAGLESMILGEYQILGQVKEAHAAALAAKFAGRELDRVLRDAISAAKRVKTELDIGAVPPSVCRAGMETVDRLFGVKGRRVFVIGSGKTGTLAARIAKGLGAQSLAVCNRSPERTRRLVEGAGAVAVDYEARHEMIGACDIVVSATASPHIVVRAESLKLMRPVCFLDLASPRDVEPAVGELPLATLISIDTIGELAAGDRREREKLTAEGMKIIRRAVAETMVGVGLGG